MVAHADIGDLLVDTISAEEVGTFKPGPEIYRHAAARTETPIEEIAHVSAGYFDVYGAMNAGMQGVWINREGGPWDDFAGEPDVEVASFHELVETLA